MPRFTNPCRFAEVHSMDNSENYFGPEAPKQRNAKYLTVVIYDISDNRQRNRIVKYLEGFGYRVQKSAFEAWLNEQEFSVLCKGLNTIVQPDDHVKIYRLKGTSDSYVWGDAPTFEPDDVIII